MNDESPVDFFLAKMEPRSLHSWFEIFTKIAFCSGIYWVANNYVSTGKHLLPRLAIILIGLSALVWAVLLWWQSFRMATNLFSRVPKIDRFAMYPIGFILLLMLLLLIGFVTMVFTLGPFLFLGRLAGA